MKNSLILPCTLLSFILAVGSAQAGGDNPFKKAKCDSGQKCESGQKCDMMAQQKSGEAQGLRGQAKKMLEMAQQNPEKAALCQQIAQGFSAAADIRDKQASAMKNQDTQTFQALEQDLNAIKQRTEPLCQQLWNNGGGKKCEGGDKKSCDTGAESKKCDTKGQTQGQCTTKTASFDSSKSSDSSSNGLASQPQAGKGWLDEATAK